MALKYSIFYEFIRNTIESASLKNGEKQNCVHAEALWGEGGGKVTVVRCVT